MNSPGLQCSRAPGPSEWSLLGYSDCVLYSVHVVTPPHFIHHIHTSSSCTSIVYTWLQGLTISQTYCVSSINIIAPPSPHLWGAGGRHLAHQARPKSVVYGCIIVPLGPSQAVTGPHTTAIVYTCTTPKPLDADVQVWGTQQQSCTLIHVHISCIYHPAFDSCVQNTWLSVGLSIFWMWHMLSVFFFRLPGPHKSSCLHLLIHVHLSYTYNCRFNQHKCQRCLQACPRVGVALPLMQ